MRTLDQILTDINARIATTLSYSNVTYWNEAILQPKDDKTFPIINSGNKTGLEAAKELRKESNIPLIFLSGNNSQDILKKISNLGQSTFISKPYSEGDIKEKFIELGLIHAS